MDKYFSLLFWKALRLSIRRSNMVLLVISFIISFLLFKIAENSDATGKFMGLSDESWLSVTASMFAATLFLFLQSFIGLISATEENVYRQKYREYVDTFELRNIFSQRGAPDILAVYESIIRNATKRIWAIGMTNRHVIDQHTDSIVNAIRRHPIDVRIAFWNPASKIQIAHREEDKLASLIDIQCELEDGAAGHANWDSTIKGRQNRLKARVEESGSCEGMIRIINISLPSNFSCLVVDEDLFFFPFLSGPESTNDPIIHCSANGGIGKRVYEHFERIMESGLVSETIYHRDANEDIIDRL
jgi:hypothetical protein